MAILIPKWKRYKTELPKGPVEIDWSHIVAENLASLIIPSRRIEAVNYSDLTFLSSPVFVDENEPVGFNLTSKTEIDGIDGNWNNLVTKNNGAFGAVWTPYTNAADQYIMSMRYTGTNSRMYLIDYSNAVQFGWASSFNLSTTGTWVVGKQNSIILSWSAANSATCYFGGASVGTSSLTNTDSPDSSAIGVASSAKTNSTYSAQGYCPIAFVWSNYISNDVAESIEDSPFEILKPYNRRVYFYTSGAYTLIGAAGTFTLTGQSALLLADKLLTSNAGTFALTGQDAGLLAGRVLTSDSGNFTLSGQDAALLSDRILTGETGTFILSGQDATLTYTPNANAYVLTCDAGSFVFTGQDAGLITDRVLSGEAAAFTLLGQDASLLAGRILTAEQAAFTLTGQDALLVANRVLTADAGSFSLSGQDATLLYTPVGSYILTADSGAFSVTGQSANLLYNRVLSGEAGSFTVTGIDASLLRGLSLPAEAGSFLLSGQDATLTYTHGYILTCETGSYALSGQDASLLVDRILSAGTGGFTLTGNSANLTAGAVNNGVVGDDNWLICIKGSSNKVLIKGMENTSIIKGFDNDITIH